MARPSNLERMSFADLQAMRGEIESLIVKKHAEEKDALKQKLAEMARAKGFDLSEIMGTDRRKGGVVAVKYRDPKNAGNTWTGRGRMPLWMAAATKARGVSREDFLI